MDLINIPSNLNSINEGCHWLNTVSIAWKCEVYYEIQVSFDILWPGNSCKEPQLGEQRKSPLTRKSLQVLNTAVLDKKLPSVVFPCHSCLAFLHWLGYTKLWRQDTSLFIPACENYLLIYSITSCPQKVMSYVQEAPI